MNAIKRTLFLIMLFFLVLLDLNAQNTEKFYDYKWTECKPNEARFYSITTKTDTGYSRKDFYIKEKKLQMSGNYLDSLCKFKNGSFIFYHANGVLESIGKYKNNKKEGIWMNFHNNAFMKDSIVYSDGKQIGKSLSWYPNGFPSDSIVLNENRSGIHVSWFDNGVPATVGRYTEEMKKHGKWKYFHKNGNISSIELFDKSKLVYKQYFNEYGELLTDTTCTDRKAQFEGGDVAWSKYLSEQIYFPSEYKIINADMAKVIVSFCINEEGEMENVFASTPFEKVFDSIAVKAIKKSPKWIPAISHNRRVKSTFSQVVNFKNYAE